MRRLIAVIALAIIALLGAAPVALAAPKDPKPSVCERQPDKQNCPKQNGKNAGQTDVCPNIAGVQNTVPTGLVRDTSGNCVPDEPPVTDLCSNIAGDQTVVPQDLVRTADGRCIPGTNLPLAGPPPAPTGDQYVVEQRVQISTPRVDRFVFGCREGDTVVGFGATIDPEPSSSAVAGVGAQQQGDNTVQFAFYNTTTDTYTATETVICQPAA